MGRVGIDRRRPGRVPLRRMLEVALIEDEESLLRVPLLVAALRERHRRPRLTQRKQLERTALDVLPDPRSRLEEVVVTKNGRPAAILINVQEYARLKETLDVLSDPALMKQISRSRAFYRSGRKGLTFEHVFGELLTPARKRRSA